MAKKVLLLLGFQNKKFNVRSKWQTLADRLEKEGMTVFLSDYGQGEPMKKPISVYAEEVKKEIEEIEPDAIIAHSMGGLVARWAIEQTDCKIGSLKEVILLESPHQGLPSSGISFGIFAAKIFQLIKSLPDWNVPNWESWQDMQEGSNFLFTLNIPNPKKPEKVLYFEIGGLFAYLWPDTFSLPETIRPAIRRVYPTVTHSGLKKKSEVADRMVKFLKD